MFNYDKNHPPIICNTSASNLFQKYGMRLFNTFFWVLFLYLFRPVLTFASWFFSVQHTYRSLDQYLSAIEIAKTLQTYGLVIVLLGVILIGWARYNQYRFKNNDRRNKFKPAVTTSELMQDFNLDETVMDQCRLLKNATMHHNEQGDLILIETATEIAIKNSHEVTFVAKDERLYRGHLIVRERDDYRLWKIETKAHNAVDPTNFSACIDLIDQWLIRFKKSA